MLRHAISGKGIIGKMKKFLIIIILVIGCILRFYNLGHVTLSLDWDEVSLGYNAYSLLLQGKDEYGNSWPLSIRSFNDYKPPVYSYLTIPSVAAFGLTEFAVRFPSAFFGTITLLSFFFLTKEFFRKSTIAHQEWIPYVAMFLLAISPWHLQFSRAAFEGNIALFFVVSGMAALLRYLNTEKNIWLLCATLFLTGSLYAYHAPRLVVPLLILGTALRYRAWIRRHIKQIILASILAIICIAPLALVFIRGSGSARLSSVSIFDPELVVTRTREYEDQDEKANRWQSVLHNRRVTYGILVIQGFLDHFSPINMFLLGDPVGRHHAPGMGHFYLIEFPFLILGIITLLKNRFSFKFLFFYWGIVAIIPAAISTGTPHAIRSLLVLPIPLMAIATGLVTTSSFVRSYTKRTRAYLFPLSLTVIVLLYAANFAYYLNQYYIQQDIEYAPEWQYGYKELIDYLKPIENKYDKIIITTAWDQPYIYFLFYKKYDPRVWVNNGEFNKGFDKYEFRKVEWGTDRALPNTLLVGGPLEIPKNEPGIIKTIEFPDKKRDVFRLYDNPQN